MYAGIGIWIRVAALALAAALSGCSTLSDASGAAYGGYQSDGSYIVSSEDERLACRQLREELDKLTAEIQAMPARAAEEEKTTPRTVGAAFSRLFGEPGDGLKSVESYKRATVRNDALQVLYERKECA